MSRNLHEKKKTVVDLITASSVEGEFRRECEWQTVAKLAVMLVLLSRTNYFQKYVFLYMQNINIFANRHFKYHAFPSKTALQCLKQFRSSFSLPTYDQITGYPE